MTTSNNIQAKDSQPRRATWRSRRREDQHSALDRSLGNGQTGFARQFMQILLLFAVAGFIHALAILLAHIGFLSPWQIAGLFGTTFVSWTLVLVLVNANRKDRNVKNEKSLLEQNAELAARLEALEDQSWEIRESEDIHRSVAEAFGDVVLHRNAEGQLTFSNQVFGKYFTTAKELPTIKAGRQTGDKPDTWHVREIEIETKVGTRWFSWTDIAIRDFESGQATTRSIGRDITEHKDSEQALLAAAERAEDANRSKTRFLATVSHEIRTPLNGVLGMGRLLAETSLSEAQRNYVDAIETSGETLLTLVENLLDTAQIEANQMQLSPSPTNIRRLVEDVAELLSQRAAEKGLLIATYIAPSVPDSITIDQSRLKQVLMNLAGNAVKFTEQGSIAIEVDLELAKDDATTSLIIDVVDNGPGIDSADQGRIFDRFTQTDSGTSRQHEGAGLGLTICRDIVALMEGHIDVQSTIGRGSRFRLLVPINETAKADIAKQTDSTVVIVMQPGPARCAVAKSAQIWSRNVLEANAITELSSAKIKDDRPAVLIVQKDLPDFAELNEIFHLGHGRIFVLQSASDRHGNTDLAGLNIDGWLTWPVRANSLGRAINGTLSRPYPHEDQQIHTTSGSELLTRIGLNILLAEDNPINALMATSLLAKLGHRVTHVENGALAVQALREDRLSAPFDLVLMDLHMPVCDGPEAIAEIRGLEAIDQTDPVRIVVLSADGQSMARKQAFEAGADAFLVKPLDFEAVANCIDNLCATTTGQTG